MVLRPWVGAGGRFSRRRKEGVAKSLDADCGVLVLFEGVAPGLVGWPSVVRRSFRGVTKVSSKYRFELLIGVLSCLRPIGVAIPAPCPIPAFPFLGVAAG
jgi:hypothetical protein